MCNQMADQKKADPTSRARSRSRSPVQPTERARSRSPTAEDVKRYDEEYSAAALRSASFLVVKKRCIKPRAEIREEVKIIFEAVRAASCHGLTRALFRFYDVSVYSFLSDWAEDVRVVYDWEIYTMRGFDDKRGVPVTEVNVSWAAFR